MARNRTWSGIRGRGLVLAGRLTLAMAAAAATGCSSGNGGGPQDAGQDSGLADCPPGTTGCVPWRPTSTTSSPSDSMDVTFALRDVLLEQTNMSLPAGAQPWRTIGANFDGIDTTLGSPTNGCAASSASTDAGLSATYPYDGVNGIDNQFGAQLGSALFPILDANLQNDVCCMQSRGRGTWLVRIRKWNGLAEDSNVTISLTMALDGTSADPTMLSFDSVTENGYVTAGTSTPAATPSWIPDTDTWYTSADSVTGGNLDQPRHVDTQGYVTGGHFVMALDVTQPLPIFLGSQHGATLELRYGTMVGHISANGHLIDGGWFGGRMASAGLLDMSYRLLASSLYSEFALNQRDGLPGGDPTSNAAACSAASGAVTPLISNFADVLDYGTNGTNTACDAISAAFSFHGVRAKGVQVAPTNLTVASPDCVGMTAVFGTSTPDETSCPFESSTCSIRAWNQAD